MLTVQEEPEVDTVMVTAVPVVARDADAVVSTLVRHCVSANEKLERDRINTETTSKTIILNDFFSILLSPFYIKGNPGFP